MLIGSQLQIAIWPNGFEGILIRRRQRQGFAGNTTGKEQEGLSAVGKKALLMSAGFFIRQVFE
jgi:hypothetical protein